MELMATYHKRRQTKIVALGYEIFIYITLSLSMIQTVSANCPPCSENDMGTIKSVCQEQGVYLHDSEDTKNSTIVCSALHNLFICIAENIPQCLEEVGSNYESYTFKPWNCSVSKHIKEYQEIVHKGCNKIESDFVPLKTEETGDQSSPSRTGDQSGYKMADQNDTSVGTTFHKHNFMFSVATWASIAMVLPPTVLNLGRL